MPEYSHWQRKYQEMLALRKKAEEAEAPFLKLAAEIARERDGLATGDGIRLEENQVLFTCRGTGIYSHDEWGETFPVELLISKAAETLKT